MPGSTQTIAATAPGRANPGCGQGRSRDPPAEGGSLGGTAGLMGGTGDVARERRRYPRKRIGQGLLDGAVWALGLYLAVLLRLDLNVQRVDIADLLRLLPIVVVAQYVAGAAFGLY